jgi:hypothetical protein
MAVRACILLEHARGRLANGPAGGTLIDARAAVCHFSKLDLGTATMESNKTTSTPHRTTNALSQEVAAELLSTSYKST